MSTDRPQKPTKSKKSETLEVRIPYDTKQAFLTACREDGTTASEVVRESVQTYLDTRERPPIEEKRTLIMKFPAPVRQYAPRIAAGAVAAVGLATFTALPVAAAPDFKAQFNRLDVNKDGVLSADEFLGPKDADAGPGDKDVVIETRTITRDKKDDAAPPADWTPGTKQESFAFSLPEELGDGSGQEQHNEFKFISHSEVKVLKDGQSSETKTFTFNADDFRKREFDSIDANSDGKVTMAEYSAKQTALLTRGFEILDANSDKFLSHDEYAKIVAPPMIKIHVGGPDTPEPPQIDLPGMKKASPEAIKAAFTRLDANKDGKLSLQEYLPPA